jgi:hypothetical protein
MGACGNGFQEAWPGVSFHSWVGVVFGPPGAICYAPGTAVLIVVPPRPDISALRKIAELVLVEAPSRSN